MTFSTQVSQPDTTLLVHSKTVGVPEDGFWLRLGATTVWLTDQQAADLGRYLLFSNNRDANEEVGNDEAQN